MGALTRRAVLAGAATSPIVRTASALPGRKMTDVALVLAHDGSGSMRHGRYEMQCEGYYRALCGPRAASIISRVNIALMSCVYAESCVQIVPWTLITNSRELVAFATKLRNHERPSADVIGRKTGITSVLRFAYDQLDACPWGVLREVVDVSGDGPNNHDEEAFDEMRAKLINRGRTINGLPIVAVPQSYPDPEKDLTVAFYRDRLIGGEGHFYRPAIGFEDLGDAFEVKFIREVAGAHFKIAA